MFDPGKLRLEGAQWGRAPSTYPNPKPHAETISKSGMAKQSNHYHNLELLYHLIGENNESEVVLQGQSFSALIDSGSHLLSITQDLAEQP